MSKMKRTIVKILLFTLLISYGLSSGFSQKKFYIKPSYPAIWIRVDIELHDSLIEGISLKHDFVLNTDSKEIKATFHSINCLQFDTVLSFKWWKRKHRFDMAKIPLINLNDTSSLVSNFIISADTLLNIFFTHYPPGCVSLPVDERISLKKKEGKIVCGFVHEPDLNTENDHLWYQSTIADMELIQLMIDLEKRGKENDTFCDSGFSGQDCGSFIIIVDKKCKYFINDLALFNGFEMIREKFAKKN